MHRILLTLAAAACLAAAAGCASGTDGAGHAADPPSTSGASTPKALPYPSTSPALTTPTVSPPLSAPPSAASTAPSGPASTVASSLPPIVAPPPVCRSGGCTRNRAVMLDGTYAVALWTGSARGGASGSSVLELTEAGRAVWWQVTAERIGGDLLCSPRPVPNCVVVDGAGAHASVATGYVRRGAALVRIDAVESDTPTTDPADLNGDGLVDVVTAINTYEPSYATGTVYWQTFRATGTGFTSTGCTKPAHLLGPEPTRLLSGTCPS